ncbi:WD40 repeat domain-containing protein [Parafrankia sp. CH37]|uniref:WD40 repeat domain-containing protein n=1 Tax=Parafrankia sp. CH37 TaxID=683308 RepID=UPI0018692806|nr:WD40 repeat domain-containing protein [Parafrankia sp. CH37]MBE3206577.1 WD40 repeat domain-containing protein [Parafrankia sp. CH37]
MIDAVFSPNSRLLATHNSGIVQLWDTATPGKGVTLLSSLAAATEPELAFFSDVEFGAESDLLVIFSRNAVTLWDTPTGGIVQSPIIISPAGEVTAAAVSPVGGLVATGGVGTVQLWDIQQAGPSPC